MNTTSTTKDIVWQLFTNWMLDVAKQGKKTLTFDELLYIINQAGHVYDNRTCKNYLECCLNNKWLTIEGENLLGFFSASTSIYKYKRIVFHINEEASFEGRSKEEILGELLKGDKKTLSQKAVENAKVQVA